MIGIIGFGMVGNAVEYGFSKTTAIICDPAYNSNSIADVVAAAPEAIFVCVPTPTDDTNYATLTDTLDEIFKLDYTGLVIVKSTVPAKYIESYDVVFNPEFLSRKTSFYDFVRPPMLILGGARAEEAEELYNKYSIVETEHVFLTDIATATLLKYTMNCFYALKVTYMNSIYDVAQATGADYKAMQDILPKHPWMGSHHFQVPGPDGSRGFGGPCLPKDTEAMVKEFDVELLTKVLELNKNYRT
jgi:UDPglucose 6-dehydrogenase